MNPQIEQQIAAHPYPLMFATLSGAHLYGFPSPDSDYDIRGAHILPLNEVIGLSAGQDTVDSTRFVDDVEVDVVTHDVRMFFGLLLNKNGNILEQIYSPYVLATSDEHEELKEIVQACITRHHQHHYSGFAHSQWCQLTKKGIASPKKLLYVYRVLLTGIHLMKTGRVEANLKRLNEDAKIRNVDYLIEQKSSGPEHVTFQDFDISQFEAEYERLRGELDQAAADSKLPDEPGGKDALNDLLIRLRMSNGGV